MLTDDQLEQMLRDAHAVERFERPRPAISARWLALAAALAAVVVPLVLLRSYNSAPDAYPRPVQLTGAAAQQRESSVLLAVYQTETGTLACFNWSTDTFGGDLAVLSSDELARKGLAMACDPLATRLLVVGMQGPADKLPSSDDRALLVARCLTAQHACGAKGFNPAPCASSGCVESGVTVRIEAIALK